MYAFHLGDGNCMCHTVPEVRGQPVGVCSVLPPESQGSNAGHQACQQALLPTEASHQPHMYIVRLKYVEIKEQLSKQNLAS